MAKRQRRQDRDPGEGLTSALVVFANRNHVDVVIEAHELAQTRQRLGTLRTDAGPDAIEAARAEAVRAVAAACVDVMEYHRAAYRPYTAKDEASDG